MPAWSKLQPNNAASSSSETIISTQILDAKSIPPPPLQDSDRFKPVPVNPGAQRASARGGEKGMGERG
eukprot:584840-Rhodomonas_salina.1